MRRRGLEGLAFLGLAVAATWPLALHFTTHAPGAGIWQGRPIFPETSINVWNLWWFRHSLVELGQSPFHTTYVFYPAGANLWFHTMSVLFGSAGLLLQSAMSLVAAHNVLVLASIVTAGMAMAMLARRLGLTDSAAFLSGCVFAFAAPTVRHLYVGHLELIWTAWLPLALWAFLGLTSTRGRHSAGYALLLGLLVGGAVYSSAYYAVYAVELLVVAALVRWREVRQPAALLRLATAAIVALLVAAPMLRHHAGPDRPTTSPEALEHDFRTHSLEPLAWVVPSFTNPIAAPIFGPIHRRLSRGDALPQETTGTIAFAVLGLAGLFVVRRREARLPALTFRLGLALALVFAVLSLGSELKILGRAAGVPLPAALLENVPILHQARAPGRHIIVAMIGVAVLAGAGWQTLRGRRSRMALLMLMAVELLPAPLPLLDVSTVSPAHSRLAEGPPGGAVLDVPLGMRDGMHTLGRPDAMPFLGQTVHQRPIVAGFASRQRESFWDEVRSTPLVGTLLDPAMPVPPRDVVGRYFDDWNIDTIVLSPSASPEERQLIESSLQIRARERLPDGWEIWWR